MKKLYLFSAIALFAGATLVGCNPSPDSISEREILSQFNNELEADAENVSYVQIATGTYDCPNDSYRLKLRQLECAKLITYDVERYAWWERSYENVRESYRVQRNYYWYSYYDTEYRTVKKTNYEFEDHYVVTVALTDKGKKLAVEDLPEPTIEEDTDLKNPEIDPMKYAWNKADLTEEWPYIANPFIEPEEPAAEEPEESEQQEVKEEQATKPANDKVDRIDSLQYEKFIQLEMSPESKILKAAEIKAIKARNIQIYEVNGICKARAEVIVATTNVNDVARIFEQIENDMRYLATTEFEFYLDKGWVLTSYELAPDESYVDDDE